MKVIDFCKKFSLESDKIPVEVRCGTEIIAKSKSCYWFAAHGGLELDRKIASVTVKQDLIVIHVK